ncbi:hypothetical protein SAY87_025037 [Trapa incisa]|uniref:Uncharacterized protein n=1 Tax=Trapa incisa TaxID=236973 RepID=A0AAN7GQ38_9MYRT|nr:hypothetical protein SAY87_025037 [Trapa incisa]
MAGLFSLGGGSSGAGRPPTTDHAGHRHPEEGEPTAVAQNPTESWFWPYGRQGQQHQQEIWLQQQQHPQGGFVSTRPEAQAHHHQQHLGGVWAVGSRPSSMNVSDESSSRSASVRGGGVNCQDCGNQAKKDCAHMRCRTCCKSRGFDCPTHVKSTWVPAAKRRERHQQLASLKGQPHHHFRRGSVGGGVDVHNRLHENHPSAQLVSTTSGLEPGEFPAQLESTALFRCVQVSSVEDPEDSYAYQTAVTIGGRVFKGILYDRGPEAAYLGGGGEGSSGGGGAGGSGLTAQQHNPVTVAAPAAEGGSMPLSAATIYDPSSSMYAAAPSGGGYMAGTLFFPHQRS